MEDYSFSRTTITEVMEDYNSSIEVSKLNLEDVMVIIAYYYKQDYEEN